MNYRNLQRWADTVRIKGKPAMSGIWKQPDGSYAACDNFVAFNVPSFAEGEIIPFYVRSDNNMDVVNIFNREQNRFSFAEVDGSHLLDFQVADCPKSLQNWHYVQVGNGYFQAKFVKKAINVLGRDVTFSKGEDERSPLLITDKSSGTRCLIMPFRFVG